MRHNYLFQISKHEVLQDLQEEAPALVPAVHQPGVQHPLGRDRAEGDGADRQQGHGHQPQASAMLLLHDNIGW